MIGRALKFFLVGVLFLVALTWVSALSYFLKGTPVSANPPAVPLKDDGSFKADITRLENNKFEISMSLNLQRNGQVYRGLRAEHVTVTEDGQTVPIKKLVSAGYQPVRACFLIDCSGSMSYPIKGENRTKLEGAREAALAVLKQLANPETNPDDDPNQLGMFVFGNKNEQKEIPEIRKAVPFGPLNEASRQKAEAEIKGLTAGGGTPLFKALDDAIHSLDGVQGRRFVLAMTDGSDNRVVYGREAELKGKKAESEKEYKEADRLLGEVVKLAKEKEVPLYVVGLGKFDEKAGPSEYLDEARMKVMGKESGGDYQNSPTVEALAGIYQRIAAALRDEYAIVYDSPATLEDGQTRNVTITIRTNDGTGTVATRQYKVKGGVFGSSVPTKPANSPQTQSPQQEPPLLLIFLPGLLVLGLLFAIPYFLSLRGGGTGVQTPPVSVVPPGPPTRSLGVPVKPPVLPALGEDDFGDNLVMPQPRPPQSVPVPPVKSNPTSQPSESKCPRCGRVVPGVPGRRYCMVDDLTF